MALPTYTSSAEAIQLMQNYRSAVANTTRHPSEVNQAYEEHDAKALFAALTGFLPRKKELDEIGE
jgi:Tat protein secretion system quality control protein TatD with DNase activity